MRRALGFFVGLLSFGAGLAVAVEPYEVLPEAMYATTQKGCVEINRHLPEDIENWDFAALYNTDLYGPGFACTFKHAETTPAKTGRAWSVQAQCEFEGIARPSTITIREYGKDIEVAMTGAHGKKTPLGKFIYCGEPLTNDI